jgi:hypothetical protein
LQSYIKVHLIYSREEQHYSTEIHSLVVNDDSIKLSRALGTPLN